MFAVPNRGVLLAAVRRDNGALRSMLELVERFYQERPWPLSLLPLERSARGWRLHASEDAELSHLLRRLACSERAQLYADQKHGLERLFEATDTDVFVASVDVMRRGPEQPVESWCTWTEGVDTLLPETDLIVLLKPDIEAVLAPAAAVHEHAGDLFEATDEDPSRWRVRGFPSSVAWEALKAQGEPMNLKG